jgi:hypothetical protein
LAETSLKRGALDKHQFPMRCVAGETPYAYLTSAACVCDYAANTQFIGLPQVPSYLLRQIEAVAIKE